MMRGTQNWSDPTLNASVRFGSPAADTSSSERAAGVESKAAGQRCFRGQRALWVNI